jgi:hypothetical protein
VINTKWTWQIQNGGKGEKEGSFVAGYGGGSFWNLCSSWRFLSGGIVSPVLSSVRRLATPFSAAASARDSSSRSGRPTCTLAHRLMLFQVAESPMGAGVAMAGGDLSSTSLDPIAFSTVVLGCQSTRLSCNSFYLWGYFCNCSPTSWRHFKKIILQAG